MVSLAAAWFLRSLLMPREAVPILLHPACVLSCTQFHTGSAYNIVPETATITGTVRYFDRDVITLVEKRMEEVCAGLAAAHGIEIRLDMRNVFDVLVNEPELSDDYVAAAAEVLGAENSDHRPVEATYRISAKAKPVCVPTS